MAADWSRIKTEYIAGGISKSALARKYGVGRTTLCHHATAEKWDEEKEQFDTKKEQVAQSKILDTQAEIAAIKARMRLMWWQRQENALRSLMEEEAENGRNSMDARKELQNYADLVTIEPVDDMIDTEDTDAYFREAGLDE